MTSPSTLLDTLYTIDERVSDDMSERDVENLFIESGFYDALGYDGTGTDIRSEFTLPDRRRPDYITLDTNESVTGVYEFKKPSRNLSGHEDQLFHYMDELRASYGVLTNGVKFRIYTADKDFVITPKALSEITDAEARNLYSTIRKREFDLTNPDHVNRFLAELDPIPLDGQAKLGQEHFFDTFRLEEGSPFADLVAGMMDLLQELRDDREAKFVRGAYDFWEATYASEPEEIPSSWQPFISGKQSLRDFMFCVESGHALLARLLLAKATEDHDFFAGTGYNGMDDYFRGLQGFGTSINLDAFPVAADNLIDDMQNQLVEGLFQDDIFVWWTDGYAEQLSRGHATGANQFEAVARGTGEVERISEATRDRFSRSVAEVFFNVLRFDFSNVEGDLLGDLLRTQVSNFGEYFAALQGVLDTVKDHMALSEEFGRDFDWTYQSGLEERINHYTRQDYSGVEEFFAPYVDDMLENVRYLKEQHNDGRLFKMFEDTVLALVVKNYMEYDYVVGNPPYVRTQNLPDRQKEIMDQLYDSTTGNYDIYCPFYERGLNWLCEDTGRLGFITPNQFMVTDYGEGLRRVLLNGARIEEVYDFRDSGVFEDAKNYPAIVILEDEQDPDARGANEIRCVRVKGDTKAPTNRDLDTAIIEAVRNHRDDPGYEDKFINVFDYPQDDLNDGYWSLMPPEELSIIHKMQSRSDTTVGDVTDSVFAGTQTSANDVFLVTPVDANRISADHTDDTVTVIPKGEDREYEIETDTLRPWLQGRDINRWRGDWSGEHAIVPYTLERDDEENITSNLINQERLEDELSLTWAYLTEHRDTLESREGGRFEGRDDWYGFGYPKSMTRFEDPKLICPEIAAEATFMVDDIGTWYFKAAYGVQLEDEFKDRTEVFAALLNSNALDFYLKHYTTLKVDGYYKYTTNYLTPLPVAWGDDDDRTEIRNLISTITTALDTESKTGRFPEAYLGGYNGELDYITYEWQTRRYPVNTEVKEDEDGEFTVQAGRSDVITDAAMYADDRDTRKRRAKYVREAVDGRNVKSGEATAIPIPRSDEGVGMLLKTLRSDETTVAETDLNELEETVNDTVYDMFSITSEEQEVIEKYLETFRVY